MCPMMDAGDGVLRETLWLTLTPDEARELIASLSGWLVKRPDDPEWHCHVVDDYGRILTVDLMEPDDPRFVAPSSQTSEQ
ncbi:MAG TPA: hypothetical protein VMF09_11320 [Solirubrobacteraceae bacterium]|nr:hypothetical protein [Solirubrobacteraceae bacterium]